MNCNLLEIEPRELKFIFEIKKQCCCSIQLFNHTNQYVAFKVKTTSPKKYCVRPNVGVIMPKSSRDFSVTMQAQQSTPPDMICKDKFLIQSTVVSGETTDEDITSSMFAKGEGKYIEETKLRVTLMTPPGSPILSLINGTLKQEPLYEAASIEDYFNKVENPVSRPMVAKNAEEPKVVKNEELELTKENEFVPTKVSELKNVKNSELNGTMNGVFKSTKIAEFQPIKDLEVNAKEDVKATDIEEFKPTSDLFETKDISLKAPNLEELPSKDSQLLSSKDEQEPSNLADLEPAQYVKMQATTNSKSSPDVEVKLRKEREDLKLINQVEVLKSELLQLDSKLSEAQFTISKLTEDRRITNQERESIKEELEKLKIRGTSRKVQEGFPLLFVCMVAIICTVLGYILRS